MVVIEDQARSLFLAALERQPEQWPAFLSEACGSNAQLHARVNELLFVPRMATQRALKREAWKAVTTACNYFETNQDRMRYDAYLRAGYPIASGVIEGACRHLIKDRMEQGGMRWTLTGALAMLNVRSILASTDARSGQGLAMSVRKEGRLIAAIDLCEPSDEQQRGRPPQWHASILAFLCPEWRLTRQAQA